jgi:hypothetical protein
MDVYLPADFYRLRDDLRDWRDAPASDLEHSRKIGTEPAACGTESRNDCADPLWKVF